MKTILLSIVAILVTTALLVTQYAQATVVSFGLTSDDAGVQTNSVDRKYVYSATPASDGIVTSGVARAWNEGTVSSDTRLVIYSDKNGHPDVLLAESDVLAIANGTTEAARNYTFSDPNQIAIKAGVPYWIGMHYSDPGTGNFTISRANTTLLVRSDPDTFSDGATYFCECLTVSNGGLNIYIEYEDAPVADTPRIKNNGGIININGGTLKLN